MPEPGYLESHLRARRDAGKKLLLPFVTAGLGEDWTDVVLAGAAAGADAIEIGIPFSDPVVDGPTIQGTSDPALAAGTPLGEVLDELRYLDVGIPITWMTYVNAVFTPGSDSYAPADSDSNHTVTISP